MELKATVFSTDYLHDMTFLKVLLTMTQHTACLQLLIKTKKWFSYESLNDRLGSFSGESGDKPNAICNKGINLGGHAAQKRWLLRLLPILVHHRIEDADNAVWLLVLLLRELVEVDRAPMLLQSQTAYLKVNYVEMRQELFPHVNLRPKHRYPLHYADLSLQFGPLIHTWTMCFESRHSYFKRCIRSSKNFKNVTKSLADRHQLYQAYQNHGGVFGPQVQVFNSTTFNPDLYDCGIRAAVADFEVTSSNSVVKDKVKVRGASYENGFLVLIR